MASSQEEKIGKAENAREWRLIVIPLSGEEHQDLLNASKNSNLYDLKESTRHRLFEEQIQVVTRFRDSKKPKRKHNQKDLWPKNEDSKLARVISVVSAIHDPVKLDLIYHYAQNL